MSPITVLPAAPSTAAFIRGVQLEAAAPSKYRARPVTIAGIRFASHKEAHRYGTLILLERAGQVKEIARQVTYSLTVVAGGRRRVIGQYVADFVYRERTATAAWDLIVEDVKGFRTPLYRWKKKHFEAEYSVRIRET